MLFSYCSQNKLFRKFKPKKKSAQRERISIPLSIDCEKVPKKITGPKENNSNSKRYSFIIWYRGTLRAYYTRTIWLTNIFELTNDVFIRKIFFVVHSAFKKKLAVIPSPPEPTVFRLYGLRRFPTLH